MSSTHLSAVWASKKPRGKARLVLLAVADCANHMGLAEASARTLAAMTGEDKSAVCGILDDLCGAGFLRLVSASRGSIPARYQVTVTPGVSVPHEDARAPDEPQESEPDATPSGAKKLSSHEIQRLSHLVDDWGPPYPPEAHQIPTRPPPASDPTSVTQADVDAVLVAAGIKSTLETPLYWRRQEHREDLAALLKKTGYSLDGLCSLLRTAVSAGRVLNHKPRRLKELETLIGKGARA